MTEVMVMKNTKTGVVVSSECWAHTKQEVNRVTTTALDGTVYSQIIGTPTKIIQVEGGVYDNKLDDLRNADASGVVLSLSNSSVTWYGRILNLQEGTKIVNGRRKFSATLSWEVGT